MLEVRLQKQLLSVAGMLSLQLSFSVRQGERLAIIGASGSGKTTLLRMIAGLLKPDEGTIQFHNQCWLDSEKSINLPPQQRKVGFMFQEYALFPNMTVQQNLEFALQKKQPKNVVQELMQVMELEGLAARFPRTLSGGQQQRVALARAMVAQPQLLLLDEPLSALDAPMREKLQDYILKVHEKYSLTTIWVTHNAAEVAKIAHRVLLLENGVLFEQPVQSMPVEIPGIIKSIQDIDNQKIASILLSSNEPELNPNENVFIIKKS